MSRRRARSRAVALACVAVFAFAACSDDEAPTRDQAGVVTKAGKVSVFELKPGDCLDPPADVSGEIAEIRVVPCTDPHTQEVFAKPDSTTEPVTEGPLGKTKTQITVRSLSVFQPLNDGNR